MEFSDDIKNILLGHGITPLNLKIENSNNIEGNICKIIYFHCETSKNLELELVLKVSNNDSKLFNDAKRLDLFNNEDLFYSLITPSINIPKYFGSFQKENKNCILLGNINVTGKGKFNLKLNNNQDYLFKCIDIIFEFHSQYYYNETIPENFKSIKKINEIKHFEELVNEKFDKFISKRKKDISQKLLKTIFEIKKNYRNILDNLSKFPLSICHGDFKSSNMLFKDNDIVLFDWQYVQFNKGVSDIVFLMIECMDFNKNLFNKIKEYYFNLQNKKFGISREQYEFDFRNALMAFPFLVMIWFNSEDEDDLESSDYKDSPDFFRINYLKCLEEWI